MKRSIFITVLLGILISSTCRAEDIALPDTTLSFTLWRPDRAGIWINSNKDQPFVGPPVPPPWWRDSEWWKCNEISYRSPCFWTSTAAVIVGGIIIYSLSQKYEGRN